MLSTINEKLKAHNKGSNVSGREVCVTGDGSLSHCANRYIIKKIVYKEIIMPRERRKLSKTGTYHIMLRGNERKSIFPEEEDYRKFLQILTAKDRRYF